MRSNLLVPDGLCGLLNSLRRIVVAQTVDTGAVEQNEPKKLQEQPLEEGKQQRGNKNIFRDVCSYILVTEVCRENDIA